MLYAFALPFLGVTVSVREHVPFFNVFTEVPETLQIFADDLEIFGTTFDVDGTLTLRFFTRQVLFSVCPTLPAHTGATETTKGVFVGEVGATVVDDVEVVGIGLHEMDAVADVV